MTDIQKKLEDYLNDEDSSEYYPEQDVELMNRMLEFIIDLNTDNLSDDQVDEVLDIIDTLADENIDDALEDIDEGFSARKVKIKPSEKRERHREYRRNRAALKLRAKKYRRTTKFKQWKRRSKRKARQGKTATGKRIRKFL